MLREIKKLHGAALRATDGELGSIDEILFNDQTWTVRYLVVNTGGWLSGRKVLLPPAALGVLDWQQRILNVRLTHTQIEDSPGVETDEPVSRQWETDAYDYYGWPYYWGMDMVGPPWYSESLAGSADPARVLNPGDIHLRSTREMTGYGITARDGHLGHIDDFLVEDETWNIRYLAVDTRDWWPGNKVLLPLDWIGQISWPDRTVTVEAVCDQVRNSPEWNPHEPISRVFEGRLSRYYAQQHPEPMGSRPHAGTLAARIY